MIVEPQTLLREAVCSLLRSKEDLTVVGEAASAAEAIERVVALEPDLVVTDIQLPDRVGVQIIRELRSHHPGVGVLVLTANQVPGSAAAATKAGALGYILKQCGSTELLAAVEHVAAGRKYLCKALQVPRRRTNTRGPAGPGGARVLLTERQREILCSVAMGYANKEIANMLGVSSKAIQKHRGRIREVLDVRSTAGLTAYAVREGLVSDCDPIMAACPR
jgi:DNA-binding NarL/FixJ family response regulator